MMPHQTHKDQDSRFGALLGMACGLPFVFASWLLLGLLGFAILHWLGIIGEAVAPV